MNCSDVRALASNYLDAELPEELHDRVQRHLLKCAGCAHELSGLQGAVLALKTAYLPAVPHEGFIQATLAALSEELNVATRLPASPGQLVLGIGRDS